MKLPVDFATLAVVAEELAKNDRQIDNWTVEELTFWHVWQLLLEVDNGGLYQFLFNFSGDYSSESIAALEEIGAYEFAELVRRALAAFPESFAPKDRRTRRELLRSVDPKMFRPLDGLFHEQNSDDRIEKLLIEHVRTKMVSVLLPIAMAEASNKASLEFRRKNYQGVVALLNKFENHLHGSTLQKLKFARKKVLG